MLRGRPHYHAVLDISPASMTSSGSLADLNDSDDDSDSEDDILPDLESSVAASLAASASYHSGREAQWWSQCYDSDSKYTHDFKRN